MLPLNILGLIFILFGDFALFVGVLRWYKGLAILSAAAWRVNNPCFTGSKNELGETINTI